MRHPTPAAPLPRRRLPAALLAALLLTITAAGATPSRAASDARQVGAGATLIILQDAVESSLDGATFAPAADGQTLGVGQAALTDPAGAALLTFFDGSEVMLGPDTMVRIDPPPPGASGGFSIAQLGGVTGQRLSAATGTSRQTESPSAVALVRGTTYLVAVGRVPDDDAAPLAPCLPHDDRCLTAVVLLPDSDGHLGRVDVQPRSGGPSAALTRSCDTAGTVGGPAYQATLDPATCAALSQAATDLGNPANAAALGRHMRRVAVVHAEALGLLGGGPALRALAAPAPLVSSAVQDRVNAIRLDAGLPPLEDSPALAVVAQAHACDMAQQGYYEHVNLAGQTPEDRVRAAGIPFRHVGENLEMLIGDQDVVEGTVEDWLADPDHHANIHGAAFTQTGSGACRVGDVLYVAQLFLEP